jgi:hypothetical protein
MVDYKRYKGYGEISSKNMNKDERGDEFADGIQSPIC